MNLQKEPDIKIEKINGWDHRLHTLIGPLITNPEVIKLNDGYPFKNTKEYVWHIAIKDNKTVCGFLAVTENNKICNDFTWQDGDLLETLINSALKDMQKGSLVSFVADKSDMPLLLKMGFCITTFRVNYFTMIKQL